MHSDYELLRHIEDEIKFIESSSADISLAAFLENEMLKRAISRSLEIIGEAVKNISNELVVKNRDIDWRSIAGMRDRLIHGYFSVDYEIVYDVVKSKLPPLKEKVKRLIVELRP